MEVIGHLYATVAFLRVRAPYFPLARALDGPPEPVWTFRRKEEDSVAPADDRTLIPQSFNL
jgi:hypothetical protein